MDEDFEALHNRVIALEKRNSYLEEEVRFLLCLVEAGVDSWPGYEIAQEMFEEGLRGHT
jgi:hypothetical protein